MFKEKNKSQNKKSLIKEIMRKSATLAGALILILLFLVAIVSAYFFISTDSQIVEHNTDNVIRKNILILGCGIDGNRPSWLLKNRLESGIKAFKEFKAKKIILSGSTDGDYYDEVKVMKNYLLEKGFSEKDIIEDKNGNDTFDSINNSVKNGYADSMVIVTQNAHLRRAVFIANNIGAKEVIGYKADPISHKPTMLYMELREIPARIKAIVEVLGIDIDL